MVVVDLVRWTGGNCNAGGRACHFALIIRGKRAGLAACSLVTTGVVKTVGAETQTPK